jgi:menaquinone-dependent protoporphyrinogen oxidase
MAADVLIVYASKHGSTEQVARGIGETLRKRGLTTAIEPAGEVMDLSGHRAVLIGGSIYTGRWHHDARDFLKRHRRALERLPFAVFALGPARNTAEDFDGSRKQLDHALGHFPDIEPRTVAVFGGVIDREAALPLQPHGEARSPGLERGSRLGGDAPDSSSTSEPSSTTGAGAVLEAQRTDYRDALHRVVHVAADVPFRLERLLGCPPRRGRQASSWSPGSASQVQVQRDQAQRSGAARARPRPCGAAVGAHVDRDDRCAPRPRLGLHLARPGLA